MSGFTAEHAGALTDITSNGAAVTFTKVTKTAAPSTGLTTTSSASVSGYAIRVAGDPDVYERLGLVDAEAVTLLFAATTYGDTPAKGATVTWAGESFTVRAVMPLAPDGTTILSRVVCS